MLSVSALHGPLHPLIWIGGFFFGLLLGKNKKRKSMMERGKGDKILESCLFFSLLLLNILNQSD
jgi:hypothetical protein